METIGDNMASTIVGYQRVRDLILKDDLGILEEADMVDFFGYFLWQDVKERLAHKETSEFVEPTKEEWDTLRLERAKLSQRNYNSLKDFIKPLDVITHTGPQGHIYEHEFLSFSDNPGMLKKYKYAGMLGRPTKDTFKLSGCEGKRKEEGYVIEIFPGSITHINRIPLEKYEESIK